MNRRPTRTEAKLLTRRQICDIYLVPPWLMSSDTTWRDRLWWYSSPKRWFWRRAS